MRKINKNKYVVITEHNVFIENSLEKLNKIMQSKLDHNEFKRFDDVFITKLANPDINFIQDKYKFNQIALQNLVKKDNITYFFYIIIVIQIITLFVK